MARNTQSLAPLFFAFTDVAQGVLTSAMQELDISENVGGAVTTNAMINWLRVGSINDDVAPETAPDKATGAVATHDSAR
jgi:hypothetical protein